MKLIFSVVIITYLHNFCVAAPAYDSVTINCYIQYLKNSNKIDSNFPDFNHATSTETCDEIIKSKRTLVVDAMVGAMQRKSPTLKFQCIREKIVERNVVDLIFMQTVYGAMKYSRGNEYEKELQKSSEASHKALTEVVFDCGIGDQLLESFNKLTDLKKFENNEKLNYCLRKSLVQRNDIDTTRHSLNLNPTNIDVNAVNCDKEFEKMNEIASEATRIKMQAKLTSVTSEQIECHIAAIQREHFYEILLSFVFLKELNMNDNEVNQIHKKYLEKMKEITTISAMECFSNRPIY
jgi:VIT1/CCC1 family predicted Fe2+/Mn2+ transporter